MTRRFDGPVLNLSDVSTRQWYQELPVGFDPDYIFFMDDFLGIVTDLTNDWTEVKDGSAPTVTVEADTQHGRLLLSSQATTDDSGSSIQGNEIYLPTLSRRIWFETVLQSSDADQQELFIGFSVNFTSNPEALLTAANRIGFQVDDGNAYILCKTEASGVETSSDSEVDLVDATDIILGMQIIGLSRVEFYVNRLLVQTLITNVPATEMALAAYQLSGDANGTKSVSIDYIMTIVQR